MDMTNIRRTTFFVLTLFTAGMLLAASGAEPQRHRRQRRSHRQGRKLQRMMNHVLGHHAEYALYEVDGKRFAMIKQGDEHSIGLFTIDYSQAEGYRGITNSLVMMDLQGVVKEVRILDSEDTPPYVKRIVRKGFLKQFAGMKSEETREVDAVTGATITCDAIEQSVNETLKAFASIAESVDFSNGTPEARGEMCELKRIE